MPVESPASVENGGTSLPRRPRRMRRLWLLAIGVITAGALYASGALGLIPRHQARTALDAHDPETALAHLVWARRLGPPTGEIEFLRARAHRKLGQLEAVPRDLRRALDLGHPRSAIHREELLARAQAGDL